MEHTIEYGKRKLRLRVGDERVVGVIAPKPVSELADVEAAAGRAIRKPIGSPPLAALLMGKKTALIVTVNATRPSPRKLLLPILKQCERSEVRASIIIATGRHDQMSESQLRGHLGKDLVARYKVLQHDPFDQSRMVLKGRTARRTPIRVNKAIFEHDLVIGTGIIEPSYLCGWSGGRKLLMPGLAHHESIWCRARKASSRPPLRSSATAW